MSRPSDQVQRRLMGAADLCHQGRAQRRSALRSATTGGPGRAAGRFRRLQSENQRATAAKKLVVETDPVRDCSGNAVPDGTVVSFTQVGPSGKTTVDAPVKKGIARVEIPVTGPSRITVASGVVTGNEFSVGRTINRDPQIDPGVRHRTLRLPRCCTSPPMTACRRSS